MDFLKYKFFSKNLQKISFYPKRSRIHSLNSDRLYQSLRFLSLNLTPLELNELSFKQLFFTKINLNELKALISTDYFNIHTI